MTDVRTIAHYTVEHELGRGGMGVVYRAIDTKLGRAVAIKSLPAGYVNDVVWRTRFEGEARTLAAINHPNIAAIYGIESDETGTYLVLELAEGPTLSERVRVNPPGVEEALELARQIALGLSEAHAREVVHRDLKPQNVKVRGDGVVKVLDFGIAKSGRDDAAVDPLAATIVQKVNPVSTVPAFLLGTPGYMSPEQARGHAISPATDVWALGCVLYEVLAHRMAFGGETLADTIAVTMLGEPDYAALPRRTPGRVLRLIQTCLRKKAAEREVTMRGAVGVLEEGLRELSGGRVFVGAGSARGGEDADHAGTVERGNLRAPQAKLYGRDALIVQVATHVRGHRMVTLTGASGCGVSAVAQAAAAKLVDEFKGGVWWVALPAGVDADAASVLCALALNVRGRGNTAVHELIDRLGTRRALLVLDGATSACAGLVQELVQACPNVHVLTTARAGLGLAGEHVLDVPPIGGAGGDGLDAVRLFLERVPADAAAVWKARGAETVRAVQLLRGSPQAVLLAAGLAGTMSPSQFEAQLRQRAALSGVSNLETASAERVTAILAQWALDGLSAASLALLLRASLFAGPWSVRGLRAVSGGMDAREWGDDGPTAADQRLEEQLGVLGRAGLVRRLGGTETVVAPSFELPGCVKRAAREKLRATPGAEAIVTKGYREAIGALAAGGVHGGALTRLESAFADLQAVAAAACEQSAACARAIDAVLRARGLAMSR